MQIRSSFCVYISPKAHTAASLNAALVAVDYFETLLSVAVCSLGCSHSSIISARMGGAKLLRWWIRNIDIFLSVF